MTAFAWQTALILAIAYLAGCIVACFLRRLIGPGSPVRRGVPIPSEIDQAIPAAASQAAPAAAPIAPNQGFRRAPLDRAAGAAPATERFERALTGTASQAPAPATPKDASITPQPISRAQTAPPAAARPAVPAPTVTPQPIRTTPAAAARPAAAPSSDAAAIAAAAAAAALAARAAATSSPPTAPAADVRDDLTRIRAIDRALELELNRLGVSRYAQVAAWTSADVHRISDKLGFRGRISQENWIEQAQILARGGHTHYADRRARGEIATAAPVRDEGQRAARPAVAPVTIVAQPAPATGAVAPRASSPAVAERAAFAEPPIAAKRPVANPPAGTVTGRDALQRIAGVNAEIEKLLNVQGVSRYSQLAGWATADVERFDRLIGHIGRIQRENWVEQAQILARGGDTAYSRDWDRKAAEAARLAAARTTAPAASATAPPQARPAAPPAQPQAAQPQATQPKAAAAVTAPAAQPARPAPPPAQPQAAQPQGTQPKAAATVAAPAAPPSATTSPSPPTQGRPGELAGFRSVRSEAFQGHEPAALKPGASGKPDDLKRIRGIGVLIERRLVAMGVTSYQEIANWTAKDVEMFSQKLDFKGRIERENWIEQARILASGGQTEFSRRVDRGAVYE